MRVVDPDHAPFMGEWDELATFDTIEEAVAYLDDPPDDLGDPGTVTIQPDIRRAYGFTVLTLYTGPPRPWRIGLLAEAA